MLLVLALERKGLKLELKLMLPPLLLENLLIQGKLPDGSTGSTPGIGAPGGAASTATSGFRTCPA